MIQGAIFDMDGTLLDSVHVWMSAVRSYAEQLGVEIDFKAMRRGPGTGLGQAARYLRETCGRDISEDELVAQVNAGVESFYFHEAGLKDGVPLLLEELAKRQVKMCVATATDRYLAEAALARCGILSYFSAVFTGDEVGAGKDSPALYLAAWQHLGTDQARTVVVEDGPKPLQTAREAGFPTVGVASKPGRYAGDIREVADCFVESFGDAAQLQRLMAYLDGLGE